MAGLAPAPFACTVLADLGADVIRVEPPGGGRSRGLAPCADGVSLRYLTHNAGKRAVSADLASPEGASQFLRLAGTADIVFEPGPAGWPAAAGITPRQLRERYPALVVVSVSDFGWTGPYRDWQATEQVLLAMSGVLSRSGLPGRPPLLPPGQLASESVALQAAWVALAAYLQRLRTGSGDHADVSAFEATALTLDPGYGIGGSATAGAGRTRGTCTRSSAARTAGSGSACCRPGSGPGCSAGWASPPSCRTRRWPRSAPATRPRRP
jgi:crotonobetainyl-CoA:carnitine CoA-transferase CaiB-like acyl-CoA transferase